LNRPPMLHSTDPGRASCHCEFKSGSSSLPITAGRVTPLFIVTLAVFTRLGVHVASRGSAPGPHRAPPRRATRRSSHASACAAQRAAQLEIRGPPAAALPGVRAGPAAAASGRPPAGARSWARKPDPQPRRSSRSRDDLKSPVQKSQVESFGHGGLGTGRTMRPRAHSNKGLSRSVLIDSERLVRGDEPQGAATRRYATWSEALSQVSSQKRASRC
jgi:hypothetical protein